MRTWALVSQKGGSGKSTLATQLAAYAEQLGEVALVIDLDPQANACLWSQARGTKSPLVLAAAAEKLRELASTADRLGVTLVLIDTPSRVDDAALAAIQATDIVIAPTLAGLFDLGALADTVRLLRLAGKLEAAVAVINRVPQDRAAATVAHASAALERFEIAIAPVTCAIGRPSSPQSRPARASQNGGRRGPPPRKSVRFGPSSTSDRRPSRHSPRPPPSASRRQRHEPPGTQAGAIDEPESREPLEYAGETIRQATADRATGRPDDPTAEPPESPGAHELAGDGRTKAAQANRVGGRHDGPGARCRGSQRRVPPPRQAADRLSTRAVVSLPTPMR
jgi:chromosome partitioning protein